MVSVVWGKLIAEADIERVWLGAGREELEAVELKPAERGTVQL
jgi:hypothetical protein